MQFALFRKVNCCRWKRFDYDGRKSANGAFFIKGLITCGNAVIYRVHLICNCRGRAAEQVRSKFRTTGGTALMGIANWLVSIEGDTELPLDTFPLPFAIYRLLYVSRSSFIINVIGGIVAVLPCCPDANAQWSPAAVAKECYKRKVLWSSWPTVNVLLCNSLNRQTDGRTHYRRIIINNR